MPFDPAPVSLLPLREERGSLAVEWTSSAPPGSWHQVYVGRRLAWYGRGTRAVVPLPDAKARVDVGAVPEAEASRDFSASLPPARSEAVRLSWTGGRYMAPDLAGYRVYGEPSPGAGVDYARPLADLPAYSGSPTDGWGMGGYGSGGWGSVASSYSWTGPPLPSGAWTFAVRPHDAAGNEGEPRTATVVVHAPPPPPPVDPARGVRMWYDYDPATRVATLRWLPVEE